MFILFLPNMPNISPAVPGFPTMFIPAIVIIANPFSDATALVISSGFTITLSLIKVPSPSGLNVFFILTGIFAAFAGSSALACIPFAPIVAISTASS